MKFYVVLSILLLILCGVGFILYSEIKSIDISEELCNQHNMHSVYISPQPGRIYTNSRLCYDSKNNGIVHFYSKR